MTQMNTRIPTSLKLQGDEVLSRYGVSASAAMRALWQYMADHQRLSSFMAASQTDRANEQQKKMQIVKEGSELLSNFRKEQGLSASAAVLDYEDLQAEMYEALLQDYEDLNAQGDF